MRRIPSVCFILVFILTIQGCVRSNAPNKSLILRDVVVYMCSERPPLSGVLETWVKVGVKEPAGVTHEVFIPYQREDTHVPEIGTAVDVYYHYGQVHGLVGTESMQLSNAKIVDEFIAR